MSQPSSPQTPSSMALPSNHPVYVIYPVTYGEGDSHTVQMVKDAAGDDSSDFLSAAMGQIKKGGGGRGGGGRGGGGGAGGLKQGPYTCGCGELREYKILSAVFGAILAFGFVAVAGVYLFAWIDTAMRARHRRQRQHQRQAQAQAGAGLPLQNMPRQPPPAAGSGVLP
ncbi:hypothetical protein PG999_008833 [Apiospora kogelbergensis]|uniref:Uncharacterized protein n=1 Tax=Apiospora kogelbergensis TaxID=1337665 RepID=A0AAW0QJ07_9PEZI